MMKARRRCSAVRQLIPAACVLTVLMAGDLANGQSDENPIWNVAVIHVPDLGGYASRLTGISNEGFCAGTTFALSGTRAFTYWDGVMQALPELPGTGDSQAYGVSESRYVCGESVITGGRTVATLWPYENGAIDLDQWNSRRTLAFSVNSNGTVVGGESEGDNRAVAWMNGQMVLLPDLGFGDSAATALNEYDVIGGYAKAADGFGKPVYWVDGKIHQLPLIKETRLASVGDINENLMMIGNSGKGPLCWLNGEVSELPLPARTDGNAEAVNNRGRIVGGLNPDGARTRAAIWPDKNAMPIRLDDILPPRNVWVRLEVAWDINDHDQIVGQGDIKGDGSNFFTRAFLVTPVHPTLTIKEPLPRVAGQVNTVTVTGLEPGDAVTLAYGPFGGGTIIPGCRTIENVLQIENARTIGTRTADANGVATFTNHVPGSIAGKPILLQAFVRNRCTISQLIDVRFE